MWDGMMRAGAMPEKKRSGLLGPGPDGKDPGHSFRPVVLPEKPCKQQSCWTVESVLQELARQGELPEVVKVF